ncbi:glycosyltransferase family 2 protein [bacterium]|nr:glycosyltransferase family 2 protein [bacterium]
MHSDLISVIIPAYNHERYIRDAIQSVIDQTYVNLELIIINDGSPDNTGQIIESMIPECERRFSKVVYIPKENEGVVRTLNAGRAHVSGEYVYFLASDDISSPNAIETLHAFLKDSIEYGLVVGDNEIMDEAGIRCFRTKDRSITYHADDAEFFTLGDLLKFSRKDVDFNSQEFGTYASLLKGNYFPNGPLIRRSILDKVGWFNERAPLEDHYIMMQISKLSKLKYIDQPLLKYRVHSTNTGKNSKLMISMTRKTLLHEYTYAKKNGYIDILHKSLGRGRRVGVPFVMELEFHETEIDIRLFGLRVVRFVKRGH